MNLFLKTLGLLFILLLPIATNAAPVVFSDSVSFNTAISGYTKSTLDFDSSISGSLIVDGVTALSGVTFNYPILASFGVSMQIRDDFSAYSGANYLGTNDGGAFLGGDIFNLSFAYASAVGMFFLTGDQLLDGDISLTVGTTVASLSSTYETTLSDGSFVYFLGIIDRENQFNSAEVSSLGGGGFEFNVDNIITAVPSPSVLSLLLIGLVPMLCGFKIKHN
jgi:hypothetical protein